MIELIETVEPKVSSQYEDFLRHVAIHGRIKGDRTGTGTRSIFGYQMRFDLSQGFPLVTTKKVHMKSVVAELLWILSGSTNVKDLQALGCSIWDEWADEDGYLGPVYGEQWRKWEGYGGKGIDQITKVVQSIKENPDSRRHVVSAWNVGQVDSMALAPCHALFQFDVSEMTLLERRQAWGRIPRHLSSTPSSHKFGGSAEEEHSDYDDRGIPRRRLSCQLYQRSADIFLGVPFNIASYALLTHMVAQQCDLDVGDFIWTGGDCHIYSNHAAQVTLQLSREPLAYPTLRIRRKPESIFEYRPEDFEIQNYTSHPAISAPVAV